VTLTLTLTLKLVASAMQSVFVRITGTRVSERGRGKTGGRRLDGGEEGGG